MQAGPSLPPGDLARVFDAVATPHLVLTPDLVVVTANTAWVRLLGRELTDVQGRPLFDVFPPDPATVDADGSHPARVSLERARDTGRQDRPPLLRYSIVDRLTTAPVTRFWALTNTPVLGEDGATQLLVQAVEDVTAYVTREAAVEAAIDERAVWQLRYETAEADLFTRERELQLAVQDRELSARRLTALAEAALQLAATDSLQQMAETVGAAGLAAFGADGGAITVRDGARGVRRLLISSSLGKRTQVDYADLDLHDPLPTPWVARTGERLLLPDVPAQLAWSPAMVAVVEATGRQAWAVLPLRVGDRLLGSIAAGWTQPHHVDEQELELLGAFAAQCAQTLDRFQVREAERQTAAVNRQMSEAMQRSLLSEPPHPDHLQVAVRYRAASAHAQVGGDWYDAFVTESDDTTLVIGDVAGHDRNAAAAMAQIRNLLRGVAQSTAQTPGRVLVALDRAMHHLMVDELATAVLAQVCLARDYTGTAEYRLHWSNAGHPPPLLILPAGRVSFLVSEPDLLLGLEVTATRSEHQLVLPAGATVVLYTDGLVERRGEHLDVGLRRLQSAAGRLAALPVEELCDALLGAMVPQSQDDDVALLVLRLRSDVASSPRVAAAPVSVTPLSMTTSTRSVDHARREPANGSFQPGLADPQGAAQSLLLPPTPTAVRHARALVREVCSSAGVDPVTTDNVVLLTSETVTNAYIHGHSEARLTVMATPQLVRVEVSDDNSRHPRAVERDADALDGRGVDIVDTLSSRWGVIDRGKGKTVWFEVRPG